MREKKPRTQKLSSSELQSFKRQKEERMKRLEEMRQIALSDQSDLSQGSIDSDAE